MVRNFKRKGDWSILLPRSKFERRELQKQVNSICLPMSGVDKADYIFHQDGATVYYSSRVRTHLDNKRPVNWIGRGGLAEWPRRSHDLIPCDSFL